MDHNLIEFADAYLKVQKARKDFTPIKERWYSWNYWAQHTQKQFSFGQWMADCNLRFEDISGTKTYYPEADVRYNRTEGYNYYNAWRGAKLAKEKIEQTFDRIFRYLWEAITDGEPTYPNATLGEALGMDAEALRKFAAKRSWYTPRNKKGNK